MAFPQGINFRSSLGYVTDGANYEAIYSGHAAYPITTAQGNTVGWEGTIATYLDYRDRSLFPDVRLAGINFNSSDASDLSFRIDLPTAGIYNIGIAAGDYGSSNPCAWDLKDTTTLLAHLTTGSTAGQHFKDATNTDYIDTAWPGSQTLVPYTFSSTILRLYPATVGDITVIASFYVELVSAASTTIIVSSSTIPVPAPRRTQIVMI